MPFDNCLVHEWAPGLVFTGAFGKVSGTGKVSAPPEMEDTG
ncbi:MAG: hypothetical protein Q8S57_07215 [Methanoregula sp.]|nr:hypothetical protein [Methanoregula sp.]